MLWVYYQEYFNYSLQALKSKKQKALKKLLKNVSCWIPVIHSSMSPNSPCTEGTWGLSQAPSIPQLIL